MRDRTLLCVMLTAVGLLIACSDSPENAIDLLQETCQPEEFCVTITADTISGSEFRLMFYEVEEGDWPQCCWTLSTPTWVQAKSLQVPASFPLRIQMPFTESFSVISGNLIEGTKLGLAVTTGAAKDMIVLTTDARGFSQVIREYRTGSVMDFGTIVLEVPKASASVSVGENAEVALIFNETISILDAAGFVILVNGTPFTIENISGIGASIIRFQIDASISIDDHVEILYDGTGNAADLEGNPLGMFKIRVICVSPALHDNASFPIGAAVAKSKNHLTASPGRDITLFHFNSITAENDMKMSFLHPDKDLYNWGTAEEYVQFGKKNNLRIHGHALIWHSDYQLPDFIKNFDGPQSEFEELIKDHIQTIVRHFKDDLNSWDVINEAFEDLGPGYRESVFYNNMGPDYLAKCFQWAREADPDCKLFYNDFALLFNHSKMDSVISMIDDFKDRGIPIDGIGFQAHIDSQWWNDFTRQSFKRALERVNERGLLIHISELDVKIDSPTESELKKQSNIFQEVVKIYQETVDPENQWGITMWGISDKDSWLSEYHPLLFDDDFNEKISFYGFRSALKH